LCLILLAAGIALLITACFLVPSVFPLYQWLIGLACAMIILGLGYLMNTLIFSSEAVEKNKRILPSAESTSLSIKEKAGYLVCKIMNILLCIYLLILNKMHVNPTVLLLSVALVLLQFLLDLLLQIYFFNKHYKES
jgi:hypothetical protein